MVPYDLSKELAGRGHEVTVYTSDYRVNWEWVESLPQVKVYAFKTRSRLAKFYVTPGILHHTRKGIRHFDVIHLHDYRTFQNIVVSGYAKRYDVPYVLQAHGVLRRIIEKQRLKWIYDVFFGYELLRDASKVIAVNPVEAKQYRSMGVPEEKIAVIPNGIDLSEYADLPPKGCFKRKFNIPEDRKIILYLGRIHRIKGIDFLVKAYAHLVKNMNFNDAILVIAGPDDGYLSEIQALIKTLKLDEVLLSGPLYGRDKLEAYVDADLFVLPSIYEIWGLTVLEAAACSTPVIVSGGNAIRAIVCKNKFGLSVKYGDNIQLAESIHELLSNDDLLREMGREGRKFIFENYDWANIIITLEKLYEEVVVN